MYFFAYVGSSRVKLLPLHYVLPAKVRMTTPTKMENTKKTTKNLVSVKIAFLLTKLRIQLKKFKKLIKIKTACDAICSDECNA